ncbi:MAG: type 1 glutamine amidotransferase [Gaiellaceae bacterium]
MRVVTVVHGENVGPSLFGDVVREHGHSLDTWTPFSGEPFQDGADAVLIFGGRMHVSQRDEYPWLLDEHAVMRRLVGGEVPVLGICLGAQLLAHAAGAWVGEAVYPEQGWAPVELTPAATEDPVFAGLPKRFVSFQSHYQAFAVPEGAVELARNDCCPQAFRLGGHVWAVQFHPEVTQAQVEGWVAQRDGLADPEAVVGETRERIGEWNRIGRTLCEAFLDVAS